MLKHRKKMLYRRCYISSQSPTHLEKKDENKIFTSKQVSRDMTKPTNECAPSEDRSAWASAQSDQSLRCPLEESLCP